MIKVTGPGGVSSSSDVKKKKNVAGASNFGSILESALGEEPTTTVHETTAPIAASSLLALQQVGDEEINRQKAMNYGNDMLNLLDRIRDQFLMGEVSVNDLKNVERTIKSKYQNTFTDPKLGAIINEIEVRLSVELAKLEVMTEA